MVRSFAPYLLASLALPLALQGCSGGSGGGSSEATSDFKVVSINVPTGATWKINRPIDITFTDDVDMASVSLNTIRITDQTGGSATGTFGLALRATGEVDPRTVRFRPTCPILEDFSDAGLRPGSFYDLRVLASKNGSPSVTSTSGAILDQGKLVSFATPDSDNAFDLFIDEVAGPPSVRLRGSGGVPEDAEAATRIILGGESVYFERDLITQLGQLPPGFLVPLNHYSIPENRSSVVVAFNQSVDGSQANLSRLQLEYLDDSEWRRVPAEVKLISNCTQEGAEVALEPRGILPRDRDVRVLLGIGFSDLSGDGIGIEIDNFARMVTATGGDPNPLFPGIENPESDEALDLFADQKNFDSSAAFEVPQADWGEGELAASFAFGGTGGPNGDFDWHIPDGTELILDTAGDTIVGGPDGVPTTTQAVVNGVVDVRNVYIPPTSRLLIVGPNTCTILASGKVTILGEIAANGANNPGVSTLNTTSLPEVGASGQAGGGDGGVGSYLTTQSTPRGGAGQGAFYTPNLGGQGGETCYKKGAAAVRRGAGGGGGSFGPDVYYDHDSLASTPLVRCQILIGLDASRGNWGSLAGTGAESQTDRAKGGNPGPMPFVDIYDNNNFFGSMLTAEGDLVIGELPGMWAGSGGGAGGDAVNSNSFPLIPFSPTGDEKGSGGGGGGGGIRILAIGPIQVGDELNVGKISVDGGHGGGGENTAGFNRVGGGSGGGSGGHLVLSSAAEIVIYGAAQGADSWYGDDPKKINHFPRPISATGGQGGTGVNNKGGATENGEVPWPCVAVPNEYFLGMPDVPPSTNVCYTNLPNLDDIEGGPAQGAGGDGGPGIIQLHVDDPGTRLRFPTIEAEQGLTYGTGLDVTPTLAPPPVGWRELGGPIDSMIPFFGRLSRARSLWIPLGLARVAGSGATEQVLLRFDGLDDGVPGSGGTVEQLPPILGPDDLGPVGSPPYVTDQGKTLVFDPAALAPENQVYLENPRLLQRFSVELSDSDDPNVYKRFNVASAEVLSGTGWLSCSVEADGPDLDDFTAAGTIQASLLPHFFRVRTDGIQDAYPDNSAVRISFDATVDDPLSGDPSEALSYSAQEGSFTEDVSLLNVDDWDWVRFEVEFDLDKAGTGVNLDTPRPGLELLRIQFRF